jgi:ABC-type transport system substrate-binding protein
LKKAGINIELDVYDPSTWIRLQGGSEHDLYFSGMVRPPTGDAFLEPSYHSANNPPRGVASSFYDRIDDLIDKARVEVDEKARTALYTECVQRIADDVPMYPLTMNKYVHAAHPYVEAASTFRVPENRPALELASVKG